MEKIKELMEEDEELFWSNHPKKEYLIKKFRLSFKLAVIISFFLPAYFIIGFLMYYINIEYPVLAVISLIGLFIMGGIQSSIVFTPMLNSYREYKRYRNEIEMDVHYCVTSKYLYLYSKKNSKYYLQFYLNDGNRINREVFTLKDNVFSIDIDRISEIFIDPNDSWDDVTFIYHVTNEKTENCKFYMIDEIQNLLNSLIDDLSFTHLEDDVMTLSKPRTKNWYIEDQSIKQKARREMMSLFGPLIIIGGFMLLFYGFFTIIWLGIFLSLSILCFISGPILILWGLEKI